jgi:tetratricopeptide (TPR) repeat protein
MARPRRARPSIAATGEEMPESMRQRPTAWSYLAAILLFAGADVEARTSRPTVLTPEERAARYRDAGVDADAYPDPLDTSVELRDTAARIADIGHPAERLQRLQAFLFDEQRFDFDYELRATLTAKEVFERRRGNCVSFTNLFVAMGRSLGIPVRLASVESVEGEEHRGDLVVVSSHVVAAYRDGGKVVVYDFDRRREGMPLGIRLRDDLWIDAIYLNNRGVEELIANRLDDASGFLEATVRLVPEFAQAWGNLGVVRRRAGDIGGAFDAYLLALQLRPHDAGIRTNIARLYGTLVSEGRFPDGLPDGLSEEYRGRLVEGDHAVSRGLLQSGLEAYRKAHRLAPEQVDPLVAMARTKLYLGKPGQARKLVDRALAQDPAHAEAVRLDDEMRRAGYD